MAVVSMKTNEDKRVVLEISVGAEEFQKAVDAAYRKNIKRMNVPGFRRGHAPRKMVEKLYGEGVFYEEAINNTYPAAYEAAVEEKGIEPVDRAEIAVEKVDADGYTFTATVTVKPEVSLEGYKGLEITKTVRSVTDEEVQRELERQQRQNARLVTVEDRAAAKGDTATIDFEGFVDGKAFEGGKGEKYPLELGSGSFIPGFEDQVIGHKPGEEFDVNVTFPENYHAEALKGKEAVFKCKLHELKYRELPALDDEFAKDVSEFDTLEELKADIRKKVQERHDSQSETEVENKLMEAVCQKLQAEIPQCMYDSRIDEMVQEFEYRLRSQGMDLKTYLQYAGTDMDAFRSSFAPQAKSQVQTRLALEKIVELEQITPTQEELDEEYGKIAKQYGMEADKVKEILPAKEITMNLSMGKALDLVRDSAVITEVPEELAKEPSGAQAE
ncbi:MAG TPA: trigger factor [Candidatus Anaerotruncus excrementipullorum]|uniref:Trigger factor n=1 Tax=Candidatus Anaerotruncus excrementipullorum TaxID=2838465 RepID=A0A9D1WR41_9FIRM|nr:trigger factor [Candidatus Anaerotruncus excrementipullorum]